MEASIADPIAGEEPVEPQGEQPADVQEGAPVEPVESEPETTPDLTPGTITLSTGQTDTVADISIVDAALTGIDCPVILVLSNPQGVEFKVRASEIIRYQ